MRFYFPDTLILSRLMTKDFYFIFRFLNKIQLMTQIEIPTELPTILRNFTLSVLRTKPHDIVDYAVDYFTQLQRQQQSQLIIGDNMITTIPPTSFSSTEQYEQEQTSKSNVISTG